jgi:hypothetical protein
MLDRPGYRADWDAKKLWYREHGILPWLDGGGSDGTLVWSSEEQGNEAHRRSRSSPARCSGSTDDADARLVAANRLGPVL